VGEIRSADFADELRLAAHDKLIAGTGQADVEAFAGAFERRLLVDDEHDGAAFEPLETEYVAIENLIGIPDESLIIAQWAARGLDIIERESVALRAPTAAVLNSAHDSIRSLYSAAYGWEPSSEKPADLQSGSPMRAHVRRWISDWDLARLYPDKEIGMETDDLPVGSYDEDEALSEESETDDE
jgi:hypothetical protein